MTPAQQALGGRWRKLKDGAYSRKYAEGLSGVVWWRPIVGMWGGQLYFKNLAQPGYTGPDGVVCLMDRLTGKHQEHELDNAVRLMALGANPALLAAVREVSEMTEKTAVEKTTAKLKRRVGKAYNDAIMELLAEGGYAPVTQALLIACGEIARVATETVTALREQAKEAEDRG